MKSKLILTHEFDASELERRIANELGFYQSRETAPKARGALVKVSHSNATWFLQEVAEKVLAGFHLVDSAPIITTYPEFSAYYRKPDNLQEEDIQIIRKEITDAYNAERRKAYEAHVATIVEHSVQRTEAEAARKAETARQKLIDTATADAVSALGEFA